MIPAPVISISFLQRSITRSEKLQWIFETVQKILATHHNRDMFLYVLSPDKLRQFGKTILKQLTLLPLFFDVHK